MPKQSAGILLYRMEAHGPSVLLVHPGGPFWAKKDLGAWSVPKGEYSPGEDPLDVAIREFEEETGTRLTGDFRPLGELRQAGGKRVLGWAVEGDIDPATIRSNVFELEWPPRSGRKQTRCSGYGSGRRSSDHRRAQAGAADGPAAIPSRWRPGKHAAAVFRATCGRQPD